MKGKTKILVALMAFSLLGAVGGALALTRNAATGNSTSPTVDSAIYLYWDSESTTSTGMSDIDSVQVNTPVYRYLTVSPKSTKSVAGTVTLTFTLAAAEDCEITGLTVNVYETTTLANDNTVAGLINGVTARPSLSSSALSGTTTFTISASDDIHVTTKYYAIKVNYDGSAHGTLGGTVNIAQSFAAAA